MPIRSKPNERRATSDERRSRNVWRIARFGERFEMGEYRRRGGLDWVRMFVTAATNQQSNESTQFLQQMDELEHYYPEQRDAYEGRFWRICRLTATQEDWLRGYLLDAERRPLSESKLAARLHLTPAATKATLAALKKVGLLECVPCPDFGQPPERPQEDAPAAQEPERKRTRAKGGSQTKSPKTRPVAAIRDDSGTFRESPEPLYELTNGNPNPNSNGHMAKGKDQDQDQDQARGNAKGVGQGQPPSAPAPAPPGPVSPQEVTTQGGRHLTPQGDGKPAITPPARATGEPRIVPLRAAADGLRMGDLLPRVVAGSTQGYAVRAEEFASEIFALLRAPFDASSREGQRELGNYRAGLLDAVDAGLGPSQIEELMAKARRDATEIAKHRKRHYRGGGSPEQYWRFLFNRHLAARIQGSDARAGPAAAMG